MYIGDGPRQKAILDLDPTIIIEKFGLLLSPLVDEQIVSNAEDPGSRL
jgi:hypothetical protein